MKNSSEDQIVKIFLQEQLKLHTPAVVDHLLNVMQFRTVPQGEQLLRTGQRYTNIEILWDGLCRGFLIDADGKDVTSCFGNTRGNVLWGTSSLGEPSNINIETLSRCTLLSLPLQELFALTKYQEINQTIQLCLFDALQQNCRIHTALNQHNAEERYLWFLEAYPGLIDVVQKRHVASFLGITPESLSRLRKNLKSHA